MGIAFGVVFVLVCLGIGWWLVSGKIVENQAYDGELVRFSIDPGTGDRPAVPVATILTSEKQRIIIFDRVSWFRACKVGDVIRYRRMRADNGHAWYRFVVGSCRRPPTAAGNESAPR